MQPTMNFSQQYHPGYASQTAYGQAAAQPLFNAGPQFPRQAPPLTQAAQPFFNAGPQFPPQAPPRSPQPCNSAPPFPPAPPRQGAAQAYNAAEPAPFPPAPPPPQGIAYAYSNAPCGRNLPPAQQLPLADMQTGSPWSGPVQAGDATDMPVPATPVNDGVGEPPPPVAQLQAGNWPVGRILGARHTAWMPFQRRLEALLHEGGAIDQAKLAEVSRHLKFSSVDNQRWSSRRSYLGTKYYFLRMPWNRVYVVREDNPKSQDGKNALRELSKDLLSRGGEPTHWSWSTQAGDRSRFTFDLL